MDEYLAENRALWDAWTGIHLDSSFYDVASFISGKDPIRVKDYEREEIGDVSGKSLLHLQCHFGLDTLSWARLGARVTGADFSPQSIDAARRLAANVDVPATFVCSNLYDLPQNLEAAESVRERLLTTMKALQDTAPAPRSFDDEHHAEAQA